MYDAMFNLPRPDYNISVEIQDIMREVKPWAKCWECHCQVAQNHCYKTAHIESDLTNSQKPTMSVQKRPFQICGMDGGRLPEGHNGTIIFNFQFC